MATDYISREKTTNVLIEYFLCPYISETYIREVVKQIPSEDVVEARRGHWVDDLFWKHCSGCGYEDATGSRYYFCPQCGADMRK